MRRVLITGSRDWVGRQHIYDVLEKELEAHPDGFVVVHGAARGADTMAMEWALSKEYQGYPVIQEGHAAKWTELGKRAGHVRNKLMVDLGADIGYAFPLKESIGTWGCMTLASEAGIWVLNRGYPWFS